VRAYIIWLVVGVLFGLLSGYFYTRAASEHAARSNGNPPKLNTMEMVGLVLAAVAALRQIAELGKPDKARKS